MCAHVGALAAVHPATDIDARRLAITRQTIDEAMITYPSLERFPEIEDAGWQAINLALRGDIDTATAVARMQRAAEAAGPFSPA